MDPNEAAMNSIEVTYNVEDKDVPDNASMLIKYAEAMTVFKQTLHEADYEISQLLSSERMMHQKVLEFRHNGFLSTAALEALSNTYKYNDKNDKKIEELCHNRALKAFGLDQSTWGVDVRSSTLGTAILHACCALSPSKGHVLVVRLCQEEPDDAVKSVKDVFGKCFVVEQIYLHNTDFQLGNYEKLESVISNFKPKVLLCSSVKYPVFPDYKRIREMCDSIRCVMVVDVSNFSASFIAGSQIYPSPFEYASYVITDLSSFFGAIGAIIFFKKEPWNINGKKIQIQVDAGLINEIEEKNHFLPALAVSLNHSISDSFKEFQLRGIDVAHTIAEGLRSSGYSVLSGSNHLVLLDLQHFDVNATEVNRILGALNILATAVFVPTRTLEDADFRRGLLLSSSALVARGATYLHFSRIVDIIDRAIKVDLQKDPSVDNYCSRV